MTDTIKAHCPRCNGERNCNVHGAIDVRWDWTDGRAEVNGRDSHKLLRCCGCETVFYHVGSTCSEDWAGRYDAAGNEEIYYPVRVTTYPAPEVDSVKPDWAWSLHKIDPHLSAIMDETYEAREKGLYILASVGLRTAFDRVTEFLQIDPGHSLGEKVKQFRVNGFISETEAMTLGVVADAGGAAAHRGWAPEKEQFEVLLETLEQFIRRTVVSGKAALEIAERIPARRARPGQKKPD